MEPGEYVQSSFPNQKEVESVKSYSYMSCEKASTGFLLYVIEVIYDSGAENLIV